MFNRSLAAKKAWKTRRENARKLKLRKAALKAWRTRRANLGHGSN